MSSEPALAVATPPEIANANLPALNYQSLGHKVVAGVPFTTPVDCGDHLCQLGLDVYVPGGSGPFVTVVLVGPSGRGYLSGLAGDLANRGILVYNADFRDVGALSGGYPAGFQDVACAVRFARASASQYGGQSGSVALLGHSLGAWVGSVVALDSSEFEGGCLAGGSGRPDAFVGFAGNYQIDSGLNAGDLRNFFGGSPSDLADAYVAANPFNYATSGKIPVRLVAGTDDGSVDPNQSRALEAFLVKQGWDATLTMVPGGGHTSILHDASTRQAIFSAIEAAYSARDAVDPLRFAQSQ
ncbi:MAG TPA: alpha/beta hydrolase [Candidatus Limnocylindrales bacterium]